MRRSQYLRGFLLCAWMLETTGTRRAWRVLLAVRFFVSELEVPAGGKHNHAHPDGGEASIFPVGRNAD